MALANLWPIICVHAQLLFVFFQPIAIQLFDIRIKFSAAYEGGDYILHWLDFKDCALMTIERQIVSIKVCKLTAKWTRHLMVNRARNS